MNDSASIAYLILQAARQITDEIQAGLAARGFPDVRPAHGFVFVRVSRGDASNTDVAEHLGVSKQAASQLVEQLVERGYLERRPHSSDARAIVLALTARGRACTRAAEASATAIGAAWRGKLGAATYKALLTSLGAVVTPGPIRPSW